MKARALSLTAATALLASSLTLLASAQENADNACTASNNLQFVCGLPAPEDLVQVPGTDWIIASSIPGLLNPEESADGYLSLINSATHTATKIVISVNDTARAPFDACSAPPNPSNFTAHGLNIRHEANGTSTLFAVGHGEREATEVFEVDASAQTPELSWIGCVPAVEGAFNNAVVGLLDGRILVTDFLHGGTTLEDLNTGQITGAVYQWTPGGTFEKLPGTDLSGPNGLEVTSDLRYMFVASGSSLLRFELADTNKPPTVIDLDSQTDNLRWTADGQLLLAGSKPDPNCAPDDPSCPQTLIVKSLDPDTLDLTTLFDISGESSFPALSSALVVNDSLWLGSYTGDRVVYTQLP